MTHAQYPPQQGPPPGGPLQYGPPKVGPPGYPPMPGHYAPGQPKKKSRVGLVIGLVAVGAIVLCGGLVLAVALSGGSKSPVGSDGTATDPQARSQAHTLNQPVRDGKFEFVVKKVSCGKTREGSSVLNQKAQGQFCEVTLTVKNIGTEPQTFDGSSQKAEGANKASYADDALAELYANTDNQTFLNGINPGNTVQGVLVFDIPKNAKIARLELHDSPFSGGVIVTFS